MKIHPILASAAISAILLLQGWLLSETVQLRNEIVALNVKMQMHIELTATQTQMKGKI